jgi:hypothetical protein
MVHQLDRYRPVQILLLRQIDFGHPTPAQAFADLIFTAENNAD